MLRPPPRCAAAAAAVVCCYCFRRRRAAVGGTARVRPRSTLCFVYARACARAPPANVANGARVTRAFCYIRFSFLPPLSARRLLLLFFFFQNGRVSAVRLARRVSVREMSPRSTTDKTVTAAAAASVLRTSRPTVAAVRRASRGRSAGHRSVQVQVGAS